jgi:hypothetical protein
MLAVGAGVAIPRRPVPAVPSAAPNVPTRRGPGGTLDPEEPMSEIEAQAGRRTSRHGDLRYLVHFFHDVRYLFKTITMVEEGQADPICSALTAARAWYWGRFSPSERRDYLKRRRFVEAAMYEEYAKQHAPLKEKVPIYFYLIPDLTEQKAVELARQRTSHGEAEPRVLLVQVHDIADTSNVTFTLNDSHTAFRRKIVEAGLSLGGSSDVRAELPDHGKVFPFSTLERLHRAYGPQHVTYEIQVWDHDLVATFPYVLVGDRRS